MNISFGDLESLLSGSSELKCLNGLSSFRNIDVCNKQDVVYDQEVTGDITLEEFEDPFSDENMMKLTGMKDFAQVTRLEIEVNTTEQPLSVLGSKLPSLLELKLDNSVLESFRDLGTNLKMLKILWLSCSGVKDLEGMGALISLEKLYIASNEITDITPLALHENLRVVDLQSNLIRDVKQVQNLRNCPSLTSLNLISNPMTMGPSFRRMVIHYVPQLASLGTR